MVKPKKKDEEKRNSYFRVGFLDSEAKKVRSIADKNRLSYSEFIRQATFDKIRRIENPENIKQQVKSAEIDLSSISIMFDEKIEKLRESLYDPNFNKMINSALEVVKNYYEEFQENVPHMKGFDNSRDRVIDVFKTEKRSLNLKTIQELTGLDSEVINNILMTDRRIKLNLKLKRFELIDQ